ncbi:MAG: phycobilisome rod-core linker polypeptide [Cyanobacteria bacterium P01_G01_bin.54]
MALPLLNYSPISRNHRVAGYEIAGDEHPQRHMTDGHTTTLDYNEIIRAAYRQVFNEQQLLQSNRQTNLESQLRNGQVTVQQFVRGLVLSEPFFTRNYECSNNYRFAQMCVQRLLGREIYNAQEKYAWSVVLATQGLTGFIDALLNSEEYQTNFGSDTVPYQRRRILPQRERGDVTFAHMPRYGADYLAQLKTLGYFKYRPSSPYNLKPWQMQFAAATATVGITALVALIVAVALTAWGIISL